MEKRAFSLREAAPYTGVSQAYLRKQIELGLLPAHRAGLKILIYKDDLDRFLDRLPLSDGPMGPRCKEARQAQAAWRRVLLRRNNSPR